jgi:hypothetical protein
MSSSALTPVQPETWHAAIESLFMFPVARIGPGTALPQTVHGGKKLVLAAVWQIDDCAAVTAGYSSSPITITDTSNGTPFIRWRTVLGTPWTSDADINRGPTSATAIETFRAAGVCP